MSKNKQENSNTRRKVLKGAIAGGAVAATSEQWKKPVVDSILLPAHAATTDAAAAQSAGITTTAVPINITLEMIVNGDEQSASASAGQTNTLANSDIGDGVDLQARVTITPPQAASFTLAYDNTDNIDSGPSSPVNGTTAANGVQTIAFSTDDLPDNGGADAIATFTATTAGAASAAVILDFN